MKENNKTTNKSKTWLILIAVLLFILIAFVVSLLTAQSRNPQATTPKQYILNSESSSDAGSNSSQSSSSAQTSASLSNTQLANQFVQDYLSQTLDKAKLDARAGQLKSEMTPSAYQSADIDNTTGQLKTMLEAYQKTKQVNTNSSVRLVNRALQNVAIYQNIKQDNSYYADVTYAETAPDGSGKYSFEKTLTFSIVNHQISSFQELSTKGGAS